LHVQLAACTVGRFVTGTQNDVMILDDNWFTERCNESGSAFSLKLKKKLHEEQTPFQIIEVYQTESFGTLLVLDGYIMLTDRDNFIYHEMMTHPALYTHPGPKRVVIIGGGDCGSLREVLKHPEVEQVWQVEIDERVTRVAERFFPALCELNHDPRAKLLFEDGIRWMAQAAPASLDVVIVDSTDPIGPAQGLFSEAFYCDCYQVLGEQGLLVQQSESPLFHLNLIRTMHATLLSTGFTDVASLHFPQCAYPSGWWSATLAAKDLVLDSFREEDAQHKPFKTRYYNATIHRAARVVPQFFSEALSQLVQDT
jgi:spermidine synthase